MASSFAPDLFDGFSSFWPSPNSNYKGKSKSLRSTDYLRNPNESHSVPSTPVSSRRKYYRKEGTSGRDRSESWSDESRRMKRSYKYAPTQTSFAPPPDQEEFFYHHSGRSRSQNLDRGDDRNPSSQRQRRSRQRSFSADAADAFEVIQ